MRCCSWSQPSDKLKVLSRCSFLISARHMIGSGRESESQALSRAFRILAGGERQSQLAIRTMLGHDVRPGGQSVARTRHQTKPCRTRRSRTAPRHAGRRGPPVGPCSPEAPARRLHMSSTASASCSCRIRPFAKRPWRSPAGQHSLLTCVNPSPWAMAMVAASRGRKVKDPRNRWPLLHAPSHILMLTSQPTRAHEAHT
jgi:hypothetical protein